MDVLASSNQGSSLQDNLSIFPRLKRVKSQAAEDA